MAAGHVYEQRYKLVESGQLRTYYAAGCSCGWQHEGFRVSKEDARADFDKHAPIDTDPVGRPGQQQGDQQWPEGSA